MKKLFTFCFFALAMLIGSADMNAQTIVDINGAASVQTETLRKTVKFDSEQRDKVYEACRAYQRVFLHVKEDLNNPHNIERLNKAKEDLENQMVSILTDEQYERYKMVRE
ncbi:MAG: hypothetical protein BM564_08105 [Bacteroidetes bacterium MedPE-SWsnd-G2]|nr:MAG: hypothetical protein BM564_08105 [Bacteroidetes bacterium MedPE-SWsnd-G2]